MSSIAIITARGGSKRIPKKNIKDFLGRPIISYSIEAAVKSELFDEVMVSTDSEEIAEISKRYGAKIPFYRSEKTSDDFATTSDVLLEVINEYEKQGLLFDVGCCIYPTAPFISADKLKEAMEKFNTSGVDSLLPIVRFSYPPQRAFIVENEYLKFKYPEYLNSRSQDLTPYFHDAGQFYLFRIASFKKNKNIIAGNIFPYEVSEIEVQDIDNEIDWKLAEMKYRLLQS